MRTLYESLLDDEDDLVSKDITVADALGLQHSFVIIQSSASISTKKIDNCFKISNLNKDSKKYKDYEKYLTDGTYSLKQLQPRTIKHLSQFTELVCDAYRKCNNGKDIEKMSFMIHPYLRAEYYNTEPKRGRAWISILSNKQLIGSIGSMFHKELINNSENVLLVRLTMVNSSKYERICFIFCFK